MLSRFHKPIHDFKSACPKVQASCHATAPIPPTVHQCPEIYTLPEFWFLPCCIPAHFSFLPLPWSYLRFLDGACLQIWRKKNQLNFVPPLHEFIWLSDACIQINWLSPTLSSPSFLAWRWLRCWRKRQQLHWTPAVMDMNQLQEEWASKILHFGPKVQGWKGTSTWDL